MPSRVSRTKALLLFIVGCVFIFASGRAEGPGRYKPAGRPSASMAAHLLEFPLSFVPNVGQMAGDFGHQVDFFSAGRGYSLFLTSSQAVLAMRTDARRGERGRRPGAKGTAPEVRTAVLRMKLENANPQAGASGMDELPGKSNYFIGNNPGRWRTDVPTYARVKYQNVYPGVDLTFYGNQSHLEFDFAVAPQADPGRIKLALEGATRLTTNAQGDLIVEIGGGTVRFHKPVIYQPATTSGRDRSARRYVDGSYLLNSKGRVSFKVSDYDKSKPLIIDPMLSYSTFLGGTGDDSGNGIALDSSGNAYITGTTASVDFPTQSPISASLAGSTDAFVAKLNPSGSALVYSTYLGGNQLDQGNAIAVDSSGDVFVAGSTASGDFPATTGAWQAAFAGGQTDAYVAKISPAGDALTYATYLGGTGNDIANGIALDASGDAYVAGSTSSTDFPTAGPVQAANAGQGDAFLSKIKPDGTALVYSTYLGGSGADSGQGVAVDSGGNAYVAGFTLSTDFPTANPSQSSNAGSDDAFVAKYNTGGTALVYSTYLGGAGLDRAFSIAVDGSGNAYVAGDTTSSPFPTTSGAVQTSNKGGSDAFVTELDANGAVAYSTLLGGTLADGASGVAVDGSGNIFAAGYTQSSDFPLSNALDSAFGGGTCGQGVCFDAFVAEINPASGLVYSTYLGGSGNDYGQAIALDASGNAYVTGATSSGDFPVTAGGLQSTAGSSVSSSDAFVVEINPADSPSLGLSPQTITFADQATGTTSAAIPVKLRNLGTSALSINSISASGDFSQTNDCGSSLAAAGGSCTISVKFSPTTVAALTGAITINDGAAGSPHTVQLSGNGVAPAPAVEFSPASLTFADQTVGTTSGALPVTVTNTGSADLTISAIAASTSTTNAAASFAETDNCVGTLAAGKSCTVNVTFTPSISGSLAGTLTVTDNASGSPQTVNLSGNGIAEFTLSANQASTLVDDGTTSTTFTVTLNAPSSFTGTVALSCTNNGSATCAFSSASLTTGQSSTLTVGNLTAVAPSDLNFQVTGSSTSGSITESATVSLAVFFKNFSLAISPPLITVTAGQSGSYTLTMTPVNGFSDTVAVTCANLPVKATCTASPSSATVGGSIPTNVTINIGTAANSMMGPGGGPLGPTPGTGLWSWLAGLLALGFLIVLVSRRSLRPRHAWAGFALLLLLVAGAAACNNYYTNPITQINTSKGTPQGVYTITITAKSTNYTRNIGVNLAVD